MFFIENTPEHVRRARRLETLPKQSPKEEIPRLLLAPFSRPPQVLFDNVLIGSSCERSLEVLNPSKKPQLICLGKVLPPGLTIQLPGEWLEVEPETCYCLTMVWTPTQPTSMRETIRFTNENRGRYDVVVILKSVMNIKGKSNQPKGFKTSPGKMKKKTSKRSPVAIYKKKSEIIYNTTTKIKKSVNVVKSCQYKVFQGSNKENLCAQNDYSLDSYPSKCPFDSPASIDFNFDTSEVFSNMRNPKIMQQTFDNDKLYPANNNQANIPQNVLKPSNKQLDTTASDIFDNLTFTPLKGIPAKKDKLDKGPKIILSMNSESDFDDSLDIKQSNKENETHSIISVTSMQPPNQWLTVNHYTHNENQFVETPVIQNKKQPNTSSPKEFNSPNFSINTEFSRISDLSFFPQRFSTERKCFAKINNETQELIEDPNKLSSDTYTKDSPNTPMDLNFHQMLERPPHFFLKDQVPKMCRQALFKDFQNNKDLYDKHYLNPEHNVWQNNLRADRSPPRSITPPLQSIPEESTTHFSETHVLDKTDKQMNTFTINRTFDKTSERTCFSTREVWSKKAVRAEPELWKVPVSQPKKSLRGRASLKGKDSICGKISNATFDSSKTINQNVTINTFGNVYSQSFTVDPFLSSTYFYDEEAVEKFEVEFRRWLNCILTPPAELDSNVELKIDVGKAWIENRNKEVPAAPTKEQVSNRYHNSHRLASVRRSARALFMSPEVAQVFLKLNAQIEKKLIAIRTDRNLHLDVGLQKVIMELLLAYNPLWLRIGLETIYGTVLPLKSNSDIEGLTTFIIQRMFKNPHLKNKHSKSNAPNMLLPAYMEALKKFTLKKFFMLVFFLDQAKQRKLITHDPCLFCRNAICKESREVVIRFTRELIAGIGDITKHLRPLGYVVCHKQSYLDEYKYAVHNIAIDLRDGVRLTKVMEIILIKNGLLNQLRTPPVSRLQKVHNVGVAMNALKEANFVIVGDISSQDIADGHREKTLSLLWQLIHVFRAPLFERAANVIQTWWRKKYEVIVERRKEEERVRQKLNNAASVIQCWWRRIQYNRFVESQMQQVTTATIVLQKYCRTWLCRTRLRKLKTNVLKIETWYRSVKLIAKAKQTLQKLRQERRELERKSAVIIQSYVRRWLCVNRYKSEVKKVVRVQSLVRRFIVKSRYGNLKAATLFIQQKYKGKLLMRQEMERLASHKKSTIIIQSYWRMIKEYRQFTQLKKSVKTIEERYLALIKMRSERNDFLQIKKSCIKVQSLFRAKKCRNTFAKHKNLLVKLQKRVRAHFLMKKERASYLQLKNATEVVQKYTKSYLMMKKVREIYISQRKAAIVIQTRYRSYKLAKAQRIAYMQIRNATITVQKFYRSLHLSRRQRSQFLKTKNAALFIQRKYRAQVNMKKCRVSYTQLRNATITLQRRFRAQRTMKAERNYYLKLKSSCVTIQNAFRAYSIGKHERLTYLKQRQAAHKIQKWFRNCKTGKEVQQQFQITKHACVTLQTYFKAYIVAKKQRQEFIKIKTATVTVQKYYRSYIETRILRQRFIQIKTATVTIQRYYRSYVTTKIQRNEFVKLKTAAVYIAKYYKQYKLCTGLRQDYLKLKESTKCIQSRYRSLCAMRTEKERFTKIKKATLVIQQRYRALIAMRNQKQAYLSLLKAVKAVQTRYRAQLLMRQERLKYITILNSSIRIQRFYRACLLGRLQKQKYLLLRLCTVNIQRRFRALIEMRKERTTYLAIRSASIVFQRRFRARRLMLAAKNEYSSILKACAIIQAAYRAHLAGRKQRAEFIRIKTSSTLIQRRFRLMRESRSIRFEYQSLRHAAMYVQRRFRANLLARSIKHNNAATKIQRWYISVRERNVCRQKYLEIRKTVVTVQTMFRMYRAHKRFLAMKNAALTIQRYYRSYQKAVSTRRQYIRTRISIVKLQAYIRSYIQRQRYLRLKSAALIVQAIYRLKKQRDLAKARREEAAIYIQKNVRRYLAQSQYNKYRTQVMYVQNIWRGKLLTRLARCEFLQKKRIVIRFQSLIRGYLVRRYVQSKREEMLKLREEQRKHWAASRIQALFRGHRVRTSIAGLRAAELRQRWRAGALRSTQESLKERNEEAMEVLRNMCDIETVIRAFRSLELLTEVFPMMYNSNAASIVRRVHVYMSVTNRSVSSVDVLKSAAAVLANLARYRVTGPNIYARDRIPPILKFMWRFSNSETHLFCILSTYLWLYSKYDAVREDLTEFFHIPENHKMLVTIKGNVGRMVRMAHNTRNKFYTPQSSKFVSHTGNLSMNSSVCSNSSHGEVRLPTLEPDYGIVRVDKPRYFEDAQQAIECLFHTYKL